MQIVRYQFPETSGDGSGSDSDANWLVIGGQVSTPSVSWSFEDPCLLRTEAAALGTWLQQVAEGTKGLPMLWFDEPNVTFEVIDRPETAVTIRVILRQELAPPGSSEDVQIDTGFPVDVTMSPHDLAGCADQWNSEMNRYPPR